MVDTSGGVRHSSASLVNISSKHGVKPKSKVPGSPGAASPLTLSTINLSSPKSVQSLSLQSSSLSTLSAPTVSMASNAPGLALNWSVKQPRENASSRNASTTVTTAMSSPAQVINPAKRKRSGSSGGNNLIAMASGNGTLSGISGISVTSSNLVNAISHQTGLTGILNSGSLSSSQTGNLIAIPSVNLTNAANIGQLNAANLGNAKLSPAAAASSTSVHKNNNMFKDFSLVLTGIDSLNGQVVNISSAQLAELTNSQGQTLLLNNFASSNSGTATTSTPSITVAGSVTATRPAKRSRTSSTKSHHTLSLSAGQKIPSNLTVSTQKIPASMSISGQKIATNVSTSGQKISANALEGFKLIPGNNVISSGSLPPNTVLLDNLHSASVLTSVGLPNQTLVAITSSAPNSNSINVAGNPNQVLCAVSKKLFKFY